MRFFIMLLVIGLTAVFAVEAFSLLSQRGEIATRIDALNGEAQALRIEQRAIEDDLRYIEGTGAQVKELQSKFNYRKPDEELFILVPGAQ